MMDLGPFWPLGTKEADHTIDLNCRIMDLLFDRLSKHCNAPGCGWPISVLREQNYEVPEVGEVCATCWDIYSSLTMANKQLKNTLYFRQHHDKWKAEQSSNKRRWGLE